MDPLTGAVHDCREHLDKKYFDDPSPSSGNHIEPCARCKASSGVEDQGFTATEPLEPPVPDGSKGSEGSTEAEPPQTEAKMAEGSRCSGEEENIDERNIGNNGWGEL